MPWQDHLQKKVMKNDIQEDALNVHLDSLELGNVIFRTDAKTDRCVKIFNFILSNIPSNKNHALVEIGSDSNVQTLSYESEKVESLNGLLEKQEYDHITIYVRVNCLAEGSELPMIVMLLMQPHKVAELSEALRSNAVIDLESLGYILSIIPAEHTEELAELYHDQSVDYGFSPNEPVATIVRQ